MSIVQMTAVAADALPGQSPRPAETDKAPKSAPVDPKPAEPAPTETSQTLEIQPAQQAGVFIYTIADRTTGRVMVQLPGKDVEALAQRPDYKAGRVIDTKA